MAYGSAPGKTAVEFLARTVEKGADLACQAQAVDRTVPLVEAAGIGQVVHDGAARDMADGDGIGPGHGGAGDADHPRCAARVANGELQGLHAAERAADRREKAVETKVVEQPHVDHDHVAHRKQGKVTAVGLVRPRIEGGRSGGAVGAAEDRRAEDEEPIGIESEPRPDHALPPAGRRVGPRSSPDVSGRKRRDKIRTTLSRAGVSSPQVS